MCAIKISTQTATSDDPEKKPAAVTPGQQPPTAKGPAVRQPADLPPSARLERGLGDDASTWLDEYVEFSRLWSPRSFDGFHEAVGIWILSAIAARRVVYSFGRDRYTNISILLGGRTTLQAKTTAMDIGRSLIQEIALEHLLLPTDTTPQRMLLDMSGKLTEGYDTMGEDAQRQAMLKLAFAGQRGWVYDEFGSNIQAMMRKDGPYTDFRAILRVFDDTPPKYQRATIGRGNDLVCEPYLALLGALTPADLAPFASAGSQLWGNGYLARMALVFPPSDLVKDDRFPKGERVFPESLIEPLRTWHARLGVPKVEIEGTMVRRVAPASSSRLKIDDQVTEAYYAYDSALRLLLEALDTTDLDGSYGRFPEKALRIAAMLASLSGNCAIGIGHWARGQEIAERWRYGLHEVYNQVNAGPSRRKLRSNREKIRDALIYKKNPTARAIRQYTGLTPQVIAHELDLLVSEGNVLCELAGRTYTYRRASQEQPQSAPTQSHDPNA